MSYDNEEKYSFTWQGKKRALQTALTPSIGTLIPSEEESVDWEETQNLFIEGDNLEVLKLLQKSYTNKIKMIYIDPPYNTGKNRSYKDKFTHSEWLNMMYPRLKLARMLLKDDGVIFISIDDHEVANLRKICDEIFGEENFLAHITWQRAYSPINLKKNFSENHDFILCYAKKIELVVIKGLKRSDKSNARYLNPDNDFRGPWQSSDLSVGPAIPEKIYVITTPSGRKISPPHGYCWRLDKKRFEEFKKDGRIWFGHNNDSVPRIKRFLSEVKNRITPMTIWTRDKVGDSQKATRELKALFDGKALMDYPKPVKLLSFLLELTTTNNDIIIDFFAGSATTAHAVLNLNQEDNGNRKFIMVQLPEPCDKKSVAFKAGYKNIADIGKERIRRVIKKIKEENPKYKGDLGFKVFKLDLSVTNTRI